MPPQTGLPAGFTLVQPPAGPSTASPGLPDGFALVQPPSATAPATPSQLGEFGSEAWASITAVPKALHALNTQASLLIQDVAAGKPSAAGKRLWDGISSVWESYAGRNNAAYERAAKAWKAGNYLDAVESAVVWAESPVGLAGVAQESADDIAAGHVGKGLGRAAGVTATLAPGAVLAAPGRAVAATRRAMGATARVPDPIVAYASREGIPLTVGQRLQNPLVSRIEELNANTGAGASVIERAGRGRQTAALEATAARVSPRLSPVAGEASDAGLAIRTGLNREALAARGAQRQAYGQVEQAAARSGGLVDIASHKPALQQVFDKLQTLRDAQGSLRGDDLRAYLSLKGVLEGPGVVPLTVADQVLGGVKTLTRVKDWFDRTRGQASLMPAVDALSKAVDDAAGRVGARGALAAGRTATQQKYAMVDLMKRLRTGGLEGVPVVKQLAAAGDQHVELLTQVAKAAPAEVRQMGRAVFEDIFAKGGKRALTSWESIGPKTRQIITGGPQLEREITRLLQTMARTAERFNPSGSALTGSLTLKIGSLAAGLGAPVGMEVIQTAVQGALWSPSAVAAMRRAMALPSSAPRALAQRTGQDVYRALAPFVPRETAGGLRPAVAADDTTPAGPRP